MSTVIYTNSEPGTLIYAFPATASLANWNTARVQLNESASPNQGRWTGDLAAGEWRIFEGSSQPASFDLSVWTFIVDAAGNGSGPRTVTVAVELEGDALEGAMIRLEKGAEFFEGRTDVDGVKVFNLTDGTWSVAIAASGCGFFGDTLEVNGNESPVYTVTRVGIPPAASLEMTTGVIRCINKKGLPSQGVAIAVQLIDGPGTDGFDYESKAYSLISDVNGYCYFTELIRGARYKASSSYGGSAEFVAPDEDNFSLPEIVGKCR